MFRFPLRISCLAGFRGQRKDCHTASVLKPALFLPHYRPNLYSRSLCSSCFLRSHSEIGGFPSSEGHSTSWSSSHKFMYHLPTCTSLLQANVFHHSDFYHSAVRTFSIFSHCCNGQSSSQTSKSPSSLQDTKEEDSAEKLQRESVGGIHQNIFTLPNLLTCSRMLLAPLIGYLVLQQDFNMACGLFVLAGTTDLLDGWIARRYPSQTSALGSFLDPLADKLLITILYFTLTMAHLLPVPLTFVVIARDVLLVGGASYVRYISLPKPISFSTFFDGSRATVQLQPMLLSKVNTALQLGLVALTLAAPVFSFVDHWALQTLWWTTGFTTMASGIGYVIYKNDTFKMIRAAQKRRRQS